MIVIDNHGPPVFCFNDTANELGIWPSGVNLITVDSIQQLT
ncbi:hypothetical protein C4K35_4754 [Pseudomonas chlororaphis subsp. piscium]|nr:hypothetical protein C4K35_4754 [Pseudomonas chlororaphis subsp. piscium]